jgi:fumarate reductase iron-sulfur subunit
MTAKTTQAGRRLRFEIFRYNPEDPESTPHMQTFELDETPYMSIFIALNEIREKQDPSLQFDFACRAAICGSCGMMVNGRPSLGCRTLTSDLPDVIKLHPLPVFKLIGDLSVDTGTWFREMVEKTEGWIHAQEAFDPDAQETRMDDDTAAAIYENDRCIECGCCVASCGAAHVTEDGLSRHLPEGTAAARGVRLSPPQGIVFGDVQARLIRTTNHSLRSTKSIGLQPRAHRS